jgi:hypothetical protein
MTVFTISLLNSRKMLFNDVFGMADAAGNNPILTILSLEKLGSQIQNVLQWDVGNYTIQK